jgi:AcrR family transcriptional regulator
MAKARSRRASNVEATRAALLNVARKHFAREGYSRAEIGRIAAEAGVTTGALYHHFAGKKALFQAVAEGMEAEILAAAAAIAESDPWRRLRAAFAALIDVGAAADVQRIIFVEAPQVLGPEAWGAIELRYALGALRTVLGALQSAAVIKPYPIDLIARTLLAVLREAAAEVARSKHDPKVRAQVAELVDGVLEVLAVQ